MRLGPQGAGLRAARTLVVYLALLTSAAYGDDNNNVSVRLEPPLIGVGEITELIIEASGDALLGVRLEPSFDLVNLEEVGGPSKRQNMSYVNGQVTRTAGLSWYLRARNEGEAKVINIIVKAGERELSFPDKILQVVSEPQRRRNGRRDPLGGLLDDFFRPAPRPVGPLERPDIKIVAELSNSRPYRGQQFVYTIYRLVESVSRSKGRAHIELHQPKSLPTFDGFWRHDIEIPKSSGDSVSLGEKTYLREPIYRQALFAYNPGVQQIEAVEMDLRTVFLHPSRWGESGERVVISVATEALTIDVQALPAPPPGFSGAVGSFQLEASLEPLKIERDEASTLSLSIRGNGQINGVEDPAPEIPVGLKGFPPQGKSSTKIQRGRLTANRSWDFTIVPEATGSFTIPELDFIYFNPRSNVYETLSTEAQRLIVTADTAVEAQAPATPLNDLVSPPEPTVPPAGLEVLTAAGLQPKPKPRTLAVLGVSLTLFLVAALLVLFKRWSKPAHKQLLSQLKDACANEHPRAAAGAAEEAWREFLRDRWQVPPGQPCSQWPKTLNRAGVSTELTDLLVQLIDDLHYLRYAPQLASSDSVQQDFWLRSRQLLKRLPR